MRLTGQLPPAGADNQRYPFLGRAFFEALEQGGVDPAAGWDALHAEGPGGFWMPLYRKWHSWGEYVFDHAWAHAYRRHGLDYYPKLVTAIPYTPVPGPRWLGDPGEPGLTGLFEAVTERAAAEGASGWHILFPDEGTLAALSSLPLVHRRACHFRWYNRDYADFEDFLGAMMSRRRKTIRRERRLLAEQGIRLERRVGADIPAHWWTLFYRFYAATYFKRGQHPYLEPTCFDQLSRSMSEQTLMVMAFAGDDALGAALCFFDDTTLYGRYWGCEREFDGLHFEACYYQGIEFCIERGLRVFDPGVQGEHKALRGFEPVTTHSLHWLREPAFHRAVADFVEEEWRGVRAYAEEARTLLPYRRGD